MIIEIRKLNLAEGEEVLDVGDKVMRALARSKAKLKKSLRLIGIYNDHLVTRDAETGRLFKMALSRDGDAIILGSPEEVQQSFMTLKEMKELKGLAEKAKKVMIETGEADGHKHAANVDAEGNGQTNEVSGHAHQVQAFKVVAAGGHSHTMQKPETPSAGEEEGSKGKTKTKKRDDDDSPEYIKIEKASLWRGVV